MKQKLLLAAMLLTASSSLQTMVAQTYVGYTTGEYTRSDGVGFSTTESKYGEAIRISAAKAQQLKGARIVGVRTATATKSLSNSTIFVTKELGGTPLAEASTSSFSTKLSDSKFSTPVEIDGTSDLYVGYTTTTVNTGLKPCLFDRTSDYAAGIAYGYADGEWIDLEGRGYGAPLLQLILENAPTDYYDAVVKSFTTSEGFFKVGNEYTITGEIFNFGTTAIQSLKLNTQVGNAAPQETELTGLNIKPNTVYNFSVTMTPESTGNLDIAISAASVNDGTDADISDNALSSSIYVYPANVQRKMLIEQFTGQTCSNCPRGHTEVNSAISGQEEDFVEVAHHYGYAEDVFTMYESYAVGSWLYDPSSTYAPAVCVNRTTPYDGVTTAIFGDGSPTITAGMRYAIAKIRATEPYVSVGMQNEFDETTNSGKLTIVVHTYKTPSSEQHRLNVWLTQSGILAYQSGAGSNYSHNNVLRKSFTGNWGESINLTEGTTETYVYEYNIPEKLQSTYYDDEAYSIATEPANMKFVAFVGDVTTSNITCTVYNANEIAVTTTGATERISNVNADSAADFSVEGSTLRIASGSGSATVYNLSGQRVASLSANGSAQFEPGVYVVRSGNKTQKIVIR